jgi:hypothetical protein
MTTREHAYDAADVLIWLGIVAVALWALGKAMGWISSPVWVDMIPIFGGVATVAGISIKVGRVLQKLDVVIDDVDRKLDVVIDDVDRIEDEVKQVDKRVTMLEASRT